MKQLGMIQMEEKRQKQIPTYTVKFKTPNNL